MLSKDFIFFFIFVNIGLVGSSFTLEREFHSNQWLCPKDTKKGKGLEKAEKRGKTKKTQKYISLLPLPAANVCSVEAGFRNGQRIRSGAYMIFKVSCRVPKTDGP